VCNAVREYLPDLLALSASSPFVEGVDSGLHSARTQIFTRMFPRCGVPDVFDGWAGYEEYVRLLYRTGSIREHTQIWWSVRPHLAFPTVEVRICDAQPLLQEARSLSALVYSLVATLARELDDGVPQEHLPHRLIEENFWRAIRWGLEGEFIDFTTGETEPARARLERLVEWVQPVAEELGAAQYLYVPSANAAERQRARRADGATFREIYAEQIAAGEPVRG
jgi:carboxylate-amine ligase